MKFLLSLIFLVLSQAAADHALFLFQKGNELYEQQDFEGAIEQYQQALHTGFESGRLHYNLGNAYFKTGQIGKSILCYERAKRLLPQDNDVLFNLTIANTYVADKIVVPEQFLLFKVVDRFNNFFPIHTLGLIVLSLYLLMMTLIIMRILIRKRPLQRWFGIVIVPVVLVLVIFSFALVSNLYNRSKRVEAIVMEQKVNVVSSPADDATELFSLHEGVKVRIQDSSGNWYKIILTDGKVGWIDKAVIEII